MDESEIKKKRNMRKGGKKTPDRKKRKLKKTETDSNYAMKLVNKNVKRTK